MADEKLKESFALDVVLLKSLGINTVIVHGGGPNESDAKRRNVIGIWAGPDAHPTTGARYAYEFVRPRSDDAAHQKQIAMTFVGR